MTKIIRPFPNYYLSRDYNNPDHTNRIINQNKELKLTKNAEMNLKLPIPISFKDQPINEQFHTRNMKVISPGNYRNIFIDDANKYAHKPYENLDDLLHQLLIENKARYKEEIKWNLNNPNIVVLANTRYANEDNKEELKLTKDNEKINQIKENRTKNEYELLLDKAIKFRDSLKKSTKEINQVNLSSNVTSILHSTPLQLVGKMSLETNMMKFAPSTYFNKKNN